VPAKVERNGLKRKRGTSNEHRGFERFPAGRVMGWIGRANSMRREPDIVSRCASLSRKRKPEVALEGSHLNDPVLADHPTRPTRGSWTLLARTPLF
jgi:hypothetical protein